MRSSTPIPKVPGAHDIVTTALGLLSRDGAGDYLLTPAGDAALRVALTALLDRDDLPRAVMDLCRFAELMAGRMQAPKVSTQLLDIAALSVAELARRGQDSPKLIEEARRRAARASTMFIKPSGPRGGGLPSGGG